MSSLPKFLLPLLCAIPLAACGGGDSEPASGDTAAASTPAPTPGGGGTAAVVACIGEKGAPFSLTAADKSTQLQLEGVDKSKYETVLIEQDGGLGHQVLVFASPEDAAEGAEQVAANGFFDEVFPAGNALVIRRGGTQDSIPVATECAFAA